MEGKTIQLLQISMEDFSSFIKEAVSSEFQKLVSLSKENQKNDSDDLLTRAQASKLLNVSLTTLYHWNKEGILVAHKIRRRVYYIRNEVLEKLKNVA